MTPQEKARQTIIEKYGSWEQYKAQRYYSVPEQTRKERASKAGKASKGGGFNDPEVARKASEKSWENRRGTSE